MILISNKKSLLLFVLCLLNSNIYSMDFLKSTLHTLGKMGLFTLHHTIALAPNFAIGLNKLRAQIDDKTVIQETDKNLKTLDDTSDASEQVQHFVRQELKNAGIEHPENIRIKLCNIRDGDSICGAMNTKTLLIHSKDYKTCSLDNWLNPTPDSEYDNHDEQQFILNFWKYVIQHEAQHILHKDLNRESIFALTSALATDCAISYLVNKIPVKNALVRVGLYISSAYLKCFISRKLLYTRYKRYTEQQADNGVQSDSEILKAALKGASNLAKHSPQSSISILFKEHPSWEHRAKVFQKRLEELEKTSKE